jgi:uncharacterized protein YceK
MGCDYNGPVPLKGAVIFSGGSMRYGYLLLLALLTGCASVQQVKAPDGKDAYQVKCGNAVKEKCAAKAAELCPRGYDLLDRVADPYGDLTKVGNVGQLEIRADTTTILLVRCKE